MRSPISVIIVEIFLQHFEDIHIKQLLDTKNMLLHTRHVDVIPIICDTIRTHPHAINTHINQIHDNMKLNPTYENNVCINILYLTITHKQTNTENDIHRKPTTTDTTINFL